GARRENTLRCDAGTQHKIRLQVLDRLVVAGYVGAAADRGTVCRERYLVFRCSRDIAIERGALAVSQHLAFGRRRVAALLVGMQRYGCTAQAMTVPRQLCVAEENFFPAALFSRAVRVEPWSLAGTHRHATTQIRQRKCGA